MASVLDSTWLGQRFSPPTPLDIATIEGAIVARLRSSISAVEVVHFPDDPKNYRLTHRAGAALVVYRGATYGQVEDTAAIIQERSLEFDVTLLVRDLGWTLGGPVAGSRPGAYAILESIRAALTGFQIPGARKMYPVREKFLERDQQGGVWIYVISFALSTIAVEPSTADDFPLFIKGVAEESGGETTVTLGASPFTFNGQDRIQLPNPNVVALTVRALDGTVCTLGTDFTLDQVNGIIARISGGAIASGATVEVAWSYADVAIASAGRSAPTG